MKKIILLYNMLLVCFLTFGQIEVNIEPYTTYLDINESRLNQRTKIITPAKTIYEALLEDEGDVRNGKSH